MTEQLENELYNILKEEINKEFDSIEKGHGAPFLPPSPITAVIPYLWISKYIRPNGDYSWGVRGYGSEYQEFYKWLHPQWLKTNVADFPWDYFTFKSECKDKELEMCTLFGTHVYEDKD